jgi:hypothetical protein
MDRMRILRRILTASGLALALALLSTCSNQFSLLGALTDEVKMATGKFLVVKGFAPANGEQDVDPGSPVIVQFDRPLDMTTVTESSIVVSPMTDIDHLDFPFNTSSNTLSVSAYPLFIDKRDYTITITKGVRGTDGSEMQNELSWSFKTGDFPSGNVKIKAGGVVDAAYVTDNNPVILVIDTNVIVTRYRVSTVNPNSLPPASGWVNTPATHFEVDPFSLEAGEGEKWAWAQFSDGSRISTARFDTIIRDTIAPLAPTWDNARTTPTPSVDNTPTWWWTPSEPSPAAYMRRLDGDPATETVISPYYTYYTGGGKDGFTDGSTHYLQVAQQDAAGWWSAYSSAHSIYITPCIPLHLETGVSPRTVLQWRSQKGDLAYVVYLKAVKDSTWPKPIQTGRPYAEVSLKETTDYQWYIHVDSELFKEGYRLPPLETDYYLFTTK